MRFTSKEQKQAALTALLDCYELWTIIAETGEDKWAVLRRLGKTYRGDCPACDFNSKYIGNFCRKDCIIPWTGWYCTHNGSPYVGIWSLGKAARKTRAAEIVRLIEKAIQDFEGLSMEEICKLVKRRKDELPNRRLQKM